MDTKICGRCKQVKPLDEFHKNHKTKTGCSYLCKLCQKLADRERYIANQEKYRAHGREYYRNNRVQEMARSRRWLKENPEKAHVFMKKAKLKQRAVNLEKIRARTVVNNHVHWGTLPRATTLRCVRCGKQASQYHHHKGYAKEHKLDVVPVCRNCHYIIDRETK